MGVVDKSVIFEAVSLMDRFYDNSTVQFGSEDLQLTAVTSLFIASKNLEVDPIDLSTCIKTLCYKKFTALQFIEKEKNIRRATNYENETPN